MSLREASALISTLLVIVGTVWYVWLALKGIKVKPVLASWIVLGGTMTLSFATYWTTPRHNIVSNACNAISVVSTVSILITALWLNLKQGKGLNFNRFQKICLGISASIMIFWIILVWGLKGTGIVPNILTQILMVIGYVVTAEKFWKAKGNSEPFFTWISLTVASLLAMVTAYLSDDKLAMLFASRATLTSGILVWLMYRAECKLQPAL